MSDAPKIFPLGVGAVTVDFGNELSLSLNTKAISLAAYLEHNRFPGFIEAVPAYSSIGVFYDLLKVQQHFPESETAFAAVSRFINAAMQNAIETIEPDPRLVEIPTDFSEDAAVDIDVITAYSGLSPADVIDLFISKTYRVFMLGFLPGFTYMGEVDSRIAVPRKDSPRKKVPKGSVGIAGNQTGVYPLESPGGWQLIGRTEVEFFTPQDASPALLNPGDLVRFVSQ